MNVLSLFDGISCAKVALDRVGLPVKTYYASEIDKSAIAVSTANHPDLVRLGDVCTIDPATLPPIDLLIGGSPCQDLSIAKKDRKGLAGSRSSLFWEYVRLWKALRPRWFVLENVASMPKADRETITKELGVEPRLFDASLVSAQSRKRLFWTNLAFDLPADRGIVLRDILQPDAEVDEMFNVRSSITLLPTSKNHEFKQIGYAGAKNHCGVGGQALRVYTDDGKSTASGIGLYKVGHIGTGDAQANRVYDPAGKSSTLSANGGGLGAKTGLYWTPSPYPVHIPQGNSTQSVRAGHEQRRKLKDGKRADDDPTIDPVRRIETRNDDKCGPLTTVLKDNTVVDIPTHRIRKLTPIECERLQGLPDDYTKTVAKTNRYKCLGNAFNVDVVAHILASIPSPQHTRPSASTESISK
jgi:DNA (cytosine-5)-methyltransferase 3A